MEQRLRENQVLIGWLPPSLPPSPPPSSSPLPLPLPHFLGDLGPYVPPLGGARVARLSPRFNKSVLEFGPQRFWALKP